MRHRAPVWRFGALSGTARAADGVACTLANGRAIATHIKGEPLAVSQRFSPRTRAPTVIDNELQLQGGWVAVWRRENDSHFQDSMRLAAY
jgi:hypothetical protein